MKWISVVIILIANLNFLSGQITPEDVKPLFESLGKEQFEEANKISRELLGRFENIESPIIGVLRYANLFSGAVLVAEGKMKHKELKIITQGLKGKTLMMAAHPTTTDTTQDVFKYNVLKREEGKIISTTKASNSDNSIVYIFEHFEFDNEFEIGEYDNKDTRCRGVLKKVQLNRKKSKNWIVKIYLEDAEIHKIN